MTAMIAGRRLKAIFIFHFSERETRRFHLGGNLSGIRVYFCLVVGLYRCFLQHKFTEMNIDLTSAFSRVIASALQYRMDNILLEHRSVRV